MRGTDSLHLLVRFVTHPVKGPCTKHPYGGKVLTQVTPEFILNRVEGDTVARNGCAGVPRMRRFPNL